MKTGLSLLSLLFFSFKLNSQNIPFPPGIYLTYEELKNKTPSMQADLEIIRRSGGEITMDGGNEYKLQATIDSLDKKYMKNEIYAYVKNNSLLLNGKPHGIQKWFAKAETYGNFIAFYGSVTNSEAMNAALLGGAIGGAIAAGSRHLYVLSLRTGNVRRLTDDYMTERLKEYPSLSKKFASEKFPKDEEVLIDYIKMLNDELESK